MQASHILRPLLGIVVYIVYSGFVYDAFQLNVPRLFGNTPLSQSASEGVYYNHYIFHFITLIISSIIAGYLAGIVSKKMGGIVSSISNIILILFVIYNSKDFLNSENIGYLLSICIAAPASTYLAYIYGKKGGCDSNSNKTFYGVNEIHLLWLFIPLSFYLSSFIPIFFHAFGSWLSMTSFSANHTPTLLPIFYLFSNLGEWVSRIIYTVVNFGLIYLMWLMINKTHMLISGYFLQDKSNFIKGVFLFGTVLAGSLFWFFVALLFYTPEM